MESSFGRGLSYGQVFDVRLNMCRRNQVALLAFSILACPLSSTLRPPDHILAFLGETESYCDGDRFEARCGPGEVILVQSALYGRMRLGQCVKLDMGFLGCSEDVLDVLVPRCSGREICDVVVSHKTFPSTKQSCFELRAYLEVSYSCIPVLRLETEMCRHRHSFRITDPRGNIPVPLVYQNIPGCSTLLVWIIEGQPGQRVNISLLDFGTVASDDRGTHMERRPSVVTSTEPCNVLYATVSEPTPARTERVCGRGRDRLKHVYLSFGSKVEVQMNDPATHQQYFILSYEVIGCSDPEASPNTWFKRHGNEGVVSCQDTGHSWTVRCVDGKWSSDFENCSIALGSSLSGGRVEHRIGRLPRNMIAVVVCFVALLVGALIIGIGILTYRRNRRRRRSSSLFAPSAVRNPPDVLSKIEMTDLGRTGQRSKMTSSCDVDDNDPPEGVIMNTAIIGVAAAEVFGVKGRGGHLVTWGGRSSGYAMGGFGVGQRGVGGGGLDGEYYTRVNSTSCLSDYQSATNLNGSGNRYAHIWEMPLPVPDV